jgi:hypothetical protein
MGVPRCVMETRTRSGVEFDSLWVEWTGEIWAAYRKLAPDGPVRRHIVLGGPLEFVRRSPDGVVVRDQEGELVADPRTVRARFRQRWQTGRPRAFGRSFDDYLSAIVAASEQVKTGAS